MNRFVVGEISYPEELRNPVIDLMARHVSVRDYDPARPLPAGLATVLAAAAQSAPTSSNLQTWSAVAVADADRRRRLAELAGQDFLAEAPLFLVFCADILRVTRAMARRGYPWNGPQLDLLLVATNDAAIACQNAALAAEALGLGCCMVGNVRNRPRDVADLLELPRGVFAAVGLTVGWAARRNDVKPRLPLSVVLHEERYAAEGLDEGIDRYDRQMAATTIYEGRRLRVPGVTPPPEQDTAPYGWIEHAARRLAASSQNRSRFAAFLRAQGFGTE
jgi:nitroreductase